MHLKRLQLKNFKSHNDSTIEFDQITSIVGRNDSGKTNILRALKILLHHGDWPVSWIRYGQDTATIELTLCDGTIITRKRSKSNQSVTINKGGKIEAYEGKKDATEFIEKAIGIKKITLDETTGPEDLNFVEVNEGPYLIGGRADTVQRKVAGIVGANKIDDARSRILKKVKDLESQSSDLATKITDLTPVVEKGNTFLERINNILGEAQKLDEQGEKSDTELQILHDFVDHLNNLTSLISTNNVEQNITHLLQEVKQLSLDLGLVSSSQAILTQYKHQLEVYTEVINNAEEDEKQLALELEVARVAKNVKLKELGVCPTCNRQM